MSELKPGDRAVVISAGPAWREVVGAVVTVTSHPYFMPGYNVLGVGCGFVVVDIEETIGPYGCLRASCLMRLPPDDEAKRLFRETEKPRELANG